MTEELLPDLPHGLPTLRDRTSIYKLVRQFDELKKQGWSKGLLFEQVVFSPPNHTPKLIPIYYYSTPNTGPAIWLITGVHGHQEQAGPMAVAQEIQTIAKLGKTYPMIVIGLLNANYIKDKRFPDTLNGYKIGTSLGDFDHFVLDKKPGKPRPRKKVPSNPYAESLAPRLLQLLRSHPGIISLNLHEDYTAGRTHIYSDGLLQTNDPVAKKCVEILITNGIKLRMNTHNRSKETTRQGISSLYNGAIDNFLAAAEIFSHDRVVSKPPVPVCISIETPTKDRGKKIALATRVNAQGAVIREIPGLIDIYRQNEQRYIEKGLESKRQTVRS